MTRQRHVAVIHSPEMNPSPQPGPYPNRMATEVPPRAGRETGRAAQATDGDVALIERMQSGDEQALGAFYSRWFPVVSALISRILKSADDVEDVVEETFWQAWRQANRFAADRGSVQTWVLTIARSRALDRLRATRRLREDAIDEGSFPDSAPSVGSTLPSASDPSLDAEHSERRRLVVAALSELPQEQREALELGYFSGLSQSEIAERTGQPLGTVKTRMRLAMLKLRDRLAPLREGSQ
jgi:RNA polymerase sigma-70 factor (ECF subfamily)